MNGIIYKYFVASEGWLEKFIKGFNFTLRQITTTGQKVPADCFEKLPNLFYSFKNFVYKTNTI